MVSTRGDLDTTWNSLRGYSLSLLGLRLVFLTTIHSLRLRSVGSVMGDRTIKVSIFSSLSLRVIIVIILVRRLKIALCLCPIVLDGSEYIDSCFHRKY